MGEFDLIERFFKRPAAAAVVGIGDDCAILQPRPGRQLAVSSDMLVQGQHFFADVDPETLGHKALAVNLSDLAACGAQPFAFTLALALPTVEADWLQDFSTGLFTLAQQHGCELVGGDTTRGPMNICITVLGEIDPAAGSALLRSGAQADDDIYVSGHTGDARLALDALRGRITLPPDLLAQTRQRLERPAPRVALGLALRGVASAAIDISDGLLGDLGHVLAASGVGATIDTAAAMALLQCDGSQLAPLLGTDRLLGCVLAGGDDYELLFTAPPTSRAAVAAASATSNTPITRIGRIDAATGLRLVDARGQPVANRFASFDHFAHFAHAANATAAQEQHDDR